MKKVIAAISISLAVLLGPVSFGVALDTLEPKPEQTEEQKLEEKMKDLGKEMSQAVIDSLKVILDQELKRLKKNKSENKDAIQNQISAYEEALKKNPKDADAHLAIGKIYAEIDDGANAIVHAKKAEELYLAKKNVKGTAEARRDLRSYFQKFGFKPEDFVLPK